MKRVLNLGLILMSLFVLIGLAACKNKEEPDLRGADTPQEAVIGFINAHKEMDGAEYNKYSLFEFDEDSLFDSFEASDVEDLLVRWRWKDDVVAVRPYPDDLLWQGQRTAYQDYLEEVECGLPIQDEFDSSAITAFSAVYVDERHYFICAKVDERWFVDYFTDLDGYFGE